MATHHVTSGSLIAGPANLAVAPTPLQFLARARGLHAGVEALAAMRPAPAPAAIFLASWCLELTLKSYLAAHGLNTGELKRLGHDLIALWSKAATVGLPVSATPPRWCELLSQGHIGPEFHQRYPDDAAASLAPNVPLTSAELSKLLAVVEEAVK